MRGAGVVTTLEPSDALFGAELSVPGPGAADSRSSDGDATASEGVSGCAEDAAGAPSDLVLDARVPQPPATSTPAHSTAISRVAFV